MAIFKCKICGGELEIQDGSAIAECGYCGTKQTLPKLDDERLANLYDRANHFRRNNEFDKAGTIFEQILNEDSTDAEAYWSLVLCRYGIEYVEDPATHRRVPTMHRAQYTSVFDDENYKLAIQHAGADQRALYEQEARRINEIQKGILDISAKEDPFDVFICYKETDNRGARTHDSVLAQELYYQLKQEGFKVFFSRITLEDKLGSAYEPYIFAALNSAKVMVVIGTRPEHFNALWVKNEWSRFLALIKQGQPKMLIPAYKDMDPYDLPMEFSHLQAQDMSKLGFMQDLTRGVKKIVQSDKKPAATVERTVITNTVGVQDAAPLLRRAYLFLEDGEFQSAYEYAEKVLDLDPECSGAYVAKLLAELKCKQQDDLASCEKPFDSYSSYRNAVRFADAKSAATLKGYNDAVIARINQEAYDNGITLMQGHLYDQAISCFQTIETYADAAKKIEECRALKEAERLEGIYESAMSLVRLNSNTVTPWDRAIQIFNQIPDYKDSAEMVRKCKDRIQEIRQAVQEKQRQYWENQKRLLEEKRKKERRTRKIILIAAGSVISLILLIYFGIYPLISYCTGDYKACINVYGLTEFTVPDGVTSIPDSAFQDCDSLTSITIPNSVTSIGMYAFSSCDSLTSITIPNSVTSIGKGAFYGCDSLTSITIPNSVTSIGMYAFSSCHSLTSITLPFVGETKDGTSNAHFGYIFGASDAPYQNNYIPSALKQVVITSGLHIPNRAFCDCDNLTSITIPNSVTSIGESAFYDCDNLTSITIPNSVTSIGDSAFSNCDSLTSITIPDSVTSIGGSAFRGCDKLTSITIPNSVTSIGDSAFSNCDSLTSITIPNSVTSIGMYAFYCCDGLTSITIPSSVTSIGDSAFSDCDSLTSITIPKSVTSIGLRALGYCYDLRTINYGGTESQWQNIDKPYNWDYCSYSYTITYNYKGK